jgi:hypothetical protein
MIKRHYPMIIINNKPHPICTMTYSTEDEALQYGLNRGFPRSKILIKTLFYQDDSWNTDIDFSNIKDND